MDESMCSAAGKGCSASYCSLYEQWIKQKKKKSSGWLQQLQYLPAEQAQYETEGVQI